MSHFFRKMEAADLSVLLDDLFLRTGLRPAPHYGGLLLLSGGQPVLRSIDLDPGWALVFFFAPFFSKPEPI